MTLFTTESFPVSLSFLSLPLQDWRWKKWCRDWSMRWMWKRCSGARKKGDGKAIKKILLWASSNVIQRDFIKWHKVLRGKLHDPSHVRIWHNMQIQKAGKSHQSFACSNQRWINAISRGRFKRRASTFFVKGTCLSSNRQFYKIWEAYFASEYAWHWVWKFENICGKAYDFVNKLVSQTTKRWSYFYLLSFCK